MIARALKAAVATLAGLLATLTGILLLLVVLVGTTRTGLHWTWQALSPHLPSTIQVARVQGRLIGPLDVYGVKINTAGLKLRVGHLELRWQPAQLLDGVLQIDRLAVSGVDATQLPHSSAPAAHSSKPFNLPSRIALPLNVRIDSLALTKLNYRSAPAAKPVVLDKLALAVGATTKAIYLKHLLLKSPLLDAHGKLSMAPAAPYSLDGRLQWQARPPGYAPVDGKTLLGGSLQRLKLTQTIGKPYALQADATIIKPFKQRRFHATLQLSGTAPSKIKSSLPAGTITLHAKADGTPTNVDYQVKANAKGLPYGTGPIAIQTRGNYRQKLVTIHALRVTLSDHPTRMSGAGKVRLNGGASHVNAHLQWVHARWPLRGKHKFVSSGGRVALNGTPQQIQAKLRADVGDRGEIAGSARRDGKNLGVDLHWTALAWPLTPNSKPRMRSGKGELQVDGRLDGYTINLAAAVAVPGQTNGHVKVAGSGDKNSLKLRRIDVKTLQGQMNGHANVAWKPAIAGSADLTGKGLNPGVLLESWPGRVNFHLRGAGGVAAGKAHAQLQTLTADGTLRQQSLTVQAEGTYENNVLDLQQLKAALGDTRLAASGHASRARVDLDWSARSNDLSRLLPDAKLGGKFDARGHIAGNIKKPRIKVKASGDDLVYTDYQLKTLRLDGLVDVAGGSRSHLDLRLNKATVGGVEVHSMSLKGSGTPDNHRIELKADTSRGDAQVVLHGDYAGAQWQFRLTRARLKYPQLAPWTLAAPAKGTVSKVRQRIARTCWQSSSAQICLRGAHTRDRTSAQFGLSDLPFAYFRALTPETLQVDGKVSAKGDFSQRAGGKPGAHMKLTISDGKLVAQTEDGSGTAVPFGHSDMVFALDRSGLKLDGGLNLKQRGQIAFNARVPGGKAPLTQRRLRGSLKVRVSDIGFVADLAPPVQRLAGRLKGDVRVAGTLAKPRIVGQLVLVKGSALLPGPGLNVTAINVKLSGEQSGAVRLHASAKSGGGKMNIGGRFDLAAAGGPSGQLQIKGDTFQIFNTSDGHLWASPDLAVKMHQHTINVSGQVVVPKADITPQQLPQSAVTVSSDQVIVKPNQKQATAKVPGYQVSAKVKLVLGNNVHVKAFGLKGDLQGSLLVTSNPGEPVKGSGEINIVKGEYRAYGQGLVIERGRILFPGGPISQPGIDARAVRHPAEDVTVGVSMSGSLKQPNFSLFSEPPMSQSETLSWLVLGKPLNGTSSSEDSLVTQAALALGVTGGNTVAKKLQNSLGVDTLGIQSGSGEAGSESKPKQAALVIGKYLTPDLYVSYGLGLFKPVSTVKLQYTLSSHWKLATEASTIGSGGDVIYTIERGQ